MSIKIIPQALIEILLAHGFTKKNYDQDGNTEDKGDYYCKTVKACDMPYMKEHVVDEELVFSEDTFVVELCPTMSVQAVVVSGDYSETYREGDAGAALLLADAGVPSELLTPFFGNN